VTGPGAIFDPDIQLVETVDLGEVLERIKLDLGKEPGTKSDTEDEDER